MLSSLFIILLLFMFLLPLGSWKGNYFPHANGTLSIKEVKLDSNGHYNCVAFNKAGVNSARFHVGK